MPSLLVVVSWFALGLGIISALILIIEEIGHPQHMWIMNIVWPMTALYAGPLAVWAYFRFGRLSTKERMMLAKKEGREPPVKKKPFFVIVGLGSTHCGAGCALGDICAEWLVFATGLTNFLLPRHPHLMAGWLIDFIFAFVLGIAFQYFTIASMRGLTPGNGIWAAIKADTLSLMAWQIGMYGWIGIASFLVFGEELAKTDVRFWFMMQIAMLCGFFTSFPVNCWLLRSAGKKGCRENRLSRRAMASVCCFSQ